MTPEADSRSIPARPPVVSIELTLDDALERVVRGEWLALSELGLPSLARHPGPSNRPHITLLARRRLDSLDAADLALHLPLAVTLGAPVLFGAGTRRVLARLVIPSADLLALHSALHARAGAGDDLPHTTAGVWVPHVTLARRVRLVDLPDAVRAVGGDLSGAATALRRWDSVQRLITPLA